jgi:antitoxin ParD1/3/4
MATMNISLPDKLKQWVESKVAAGDYASASDCVRDLVRRRMEYETKLTALRTEIQKGIDSGRPVPLDLDAVIAEALGEERHGGEKQKRSALG